MLFLSEYAICLFYTTYSRKHMVFGDFNIYERLIVTCEVDREVEVAFEVSDVSLTLVEVLFNFLKVKQGEK